MAGPVLVSCQSSASRGSVARLAQALQCARDFFQRGEATGLQVVDIQQHPFDALVLGGGVDRTDDVAQLHLRVAVAAVITSAVVSLIRENVKNWLGIGLCVVGFVLIAILHVSPVFVVLLAVVVGVLLWGIRK